MQGSLLQGTPFIKSSLSLSNSIKMQIKLLKCNLKYKLFQTLCL